MHPAVLPAIATFGACSALAGGLLASRARDSQRDALLALLASLAIWSAGSLLRVTASDAESARAALAVLFIGSFFAPALWFLAMLELARPRASAAPWTRFVWLAPSALLYLGYATNDAHRLVVAHPDPALLAEGPSAWAGPLYWVFVAYASLLVLGGAWFAFAGARGQGTGHASSRAWLLGLASVIPLAGSSIDLFQWIPIGFDLTPSLLGVSVLLIALSVARYELLEQLPLARREWLEQLDEGIVLLAPAGGIVDCNFEAARLLGRVPSELIGSELVEVLESLSSCPDGEVRDLPARALASMAPERVEIATPQERRLEIRVVPLTGERGGVAGRLAVLRDRTEERRGEQEGRHAQMLESLGTLAAGIAHEVNNPLAYVRANLSQIQRMGEEVEAAATGPDSKLASELGDLREIAEETLDGVERIARIVADIRAMGGVSRRDVFGEVSIEEVAGDALRLSNLQRERAIELVTRFGDGVPRIEGSPPRLVQAALNLLVNARHAVAGVSAPRIEIETRAEPAFVALRISDNGPGIAPELQDRIFDPFFSTKGPGRGSGLGLSISVDIARDHGGSLRVESAPGCGASFELRLPRKPGDVGTR
jgi:signal transduction histidine kinase